MMLYTMSFIFFNYTAPTEFSTLPLHDALPIWTLLISALPLGAASSAALLRRAYLREPLLEAVRDVDRLVILGDGLELRDGPQRSAPRLAGALFAELGRALGRDGGLLVLAGNHDHGLGGGLVDGGGADRRPGVPGP